MRDPNRIRPTLELVQRIWEKHPDLRLLQLLLNTLPFADKAGYNLEDDELVKRLTTIYHIDN
jgi:Protein of unknown function (DUF1040).